LHGTQKEPANRFQNARELIAALEGLIKTPNETSTSTSGFNPQLSIVVQSSRVGEGRIVRNNNWWEEGMVVADNLSPQKAAVLLSLALTKTSDSGTIQRMFDEY